jgi:DNA primase
MGKIPRETIEQIAAANDIVEVINSYFPLKRAGSLYKALCPFHREKTPSFTVNPQRQIFKCFGCGAGGGVFKFVSQYENVDFPTAVRRLAERAGVRIVEEELSAAEDRKYRMRKRLLALHSAAAEWFHELLLQQEGARAREYLKQRGMTREIAHNWKLGYAPDSRDRFSEWARSAGYSREEIIQSGLVKLRDEEKPDGQYYDRFRGRIMFPVCNDLGEVIAFSGRMLDPEAKVAKYLNSPETILFVKGNVLFGLHKSKRALVDAGQAIVCEGQLDLITAYEAGVQNVIAPQGTAFTEKQARILKRYVEEVILCFDSDAAGQKATERSLGALLAANLAIRVATLPAGRDPDSFIRDKGVEPFRALLAAARDFFDFQIDTAAARPEFNTARARMQFAEKMASAVSLIGDPVFRESVISKVAARLEVSPDQFRSRIPAKVAVPDNPEEQKAPELPQMSNTVKLLCLLALRDAAARDWVLSKPWREALNGYAEHGVLVKILGADLRPDDPATLLAFAATLPAGEEVFVSELLLDKLPEHADVIVEDCWNDLEKRRIKSRQAALANRLRTPDLPMEEIAAIQKQILDLQNHLTDIARPFSARTLNQPTDGRGTV